MGSWKPGLYRADPDVASRGVSLVEAKLILADWQAAYNAEHPHSALGMLTPARFAERWREQQALAGAA